MRMAMRNGLNEKVGYSFDRLLTEEVSSETSNLVNKQP